MKICEVAGLWRKAISAVMKADNAASLLLEEELAPQEKAYLQRIETICTNFVEALNNGRLS